jgi:hypothetical protein
MKLLYTLLLLLSCYSSYSQTKTSLSDNDKLNRCITENSSYFTFTEGQPIGKGWTLLENLFKENQFVAWGEYHNSPLLSQLTAYALASASTSGYRSFCIETSPFIAAELMRFSRTPSPTDTLERLYKTGYPTIGNIPFFKSQEDAQMLTAVNKFKYDIWGIDQEFQMSFSYCINSVYEAQSKRIKQRYKPLRDSLLARWWYPNTKLLDSFKNAIAQKRLKAVLDDIKISKEIYRNGDNEGRAALMKRNFFTYFNSKPTNEKVFFKLGSNHLAKGINLQTNIYDIGNAIYELAQRNQTKFANVYFMVRYTTESGKLVDDFYRDEPENPKVFTALYNKEKWVLVDIKKLRTQLNYDNSLTKNTYQLIEKYDYVLVSPELMK